MPTLATDNFNRADENPLGNGVWTTQSGHEAVQIISNQLQGTIVGGSDDGAIYTGITWPDNQWCQCKVITLNLTTARNAEVTVRAAAGANTCYVFRVRGPFGAAVAWQTTKIVAGATTTLSSGNTALASGDTIYVEIVGTVLTPKINGVTIGTPPTDAAIASGSAGVQVWSNAGVVADAIVDDWSGGDFGGNISTLMLMDAG